jgi:D-glutamate cyclase
MIENVQESTLKKSLGVVADAIEALCCVEIRPPGSMQGVVRPLAAAAREKQGGIPILIAAEQLIQRVRSGDVVVVATGFYVPEVMPNGESDGPLGAASLAFALSNGLGVVPLILCEEQCLAPTRATLNAIGLTEQPLEVALRTKSSFVLQTFPTDPSAEQRATEILHELKPKAVIVIEKPGLNAKGVAHRGGGKAITEGRMRIEVLTAQARASDILTIAIGDNGNEAGTGLVAEACREFKQYGAICQCPCQGGIAAVDECDVTIVASVSNWGGYGIAALLGILLGNENTLQDPDTERRMLEDCLRAGAVDGVHFAPRFFVDGIPGRIHCHIIEMLQIIMHMSLGQKG